MPPFHVSSPKKLYGVLRNAYAGTLLAGVLLACKPKPEQSPSIASPSERLSVPIAVETQCGRCHNVPDPEDLPEEAWGWVLDWMGNYLGFPAKIPSALIDETQRPASPLVTASDWTVIRNYYLRNAGAEAQTLGLPISQHFQMGSFGPFREPSSPFAGAKGLGVTAAIQAIESKKRVLVGETTSQRILEYDYSGQAVAQWNKLPLDTIGLLTHGNQQIALQTGYLLWLGEDGEVLEVQEDGRTSTLAYGLPRPAEAISFDPGKAGGAEIVVACHGVDGSGGLYRLVPGIARHEIVPILEVPGLVSVQQGDLDGDGDQDLVVLRSRGHQEVLILRNTNGSWEGLKVETALSQGPSLGYMQGRLADIDGDGHLDLALLSGNNFEIPRYPSRPYHGIYVYSGSGAGSFRDYPAHFQHLPGASVLEWADFDQDGDLDVVVGSSLVDWSRGDPHGVICGWNQGNFQFRWETLSAAPTIALAVADLNQDGYPEILAGGFDLTLRAPSEQKEIRQKILGKTPWIRLFQVR